MHVERTTVRMTPYSQQNISEIRDCSNLEIQQKIVSEWIAEHKNDFIAHAVWNGTFEEKIIQNGAALPAEARLYLNGQAEYEAGSTYGSRGRKYLLTQELDSRAMEIFGLNQDETVELKELEEQQNEINEADYLLFKSLKKKMISNLNEDEQGLYEYLESKEPDTRTLNSLRKIEDKGIELLSTEEIIQFHQLSNKRPVFEKRSRLKYLKRKKNGMNVSFIRIMDTVQIKVSSNRYRALVDIGYRDPSDAALKYFSKTDNLYKYLTHKYQIWTKKGVLPLEIDKALHVAHDNLLCLQSSKMSYTIRSGKNGIYWKYGDNVLLRGKTEKIISNLSGDEAILLPPWQNQGNYFGLSLDQEDTILIGPKKDLEPLTQSLKELSAKYAYLETLTPEQVCFFKVPKHLIPPYEN